jgi:hypothetical protein
MNKSTWCWNSFSSRRSTQSFKNISFETKKFTFAKDFFVTAKSSNATIIDDMITSKINVFRFHNAINAKNQNIKKTFVKCSSSKLNAQYVKNFMTFETDIVAHINKRWKRRNRRKSTTFHSFLSSRRRSNSLSCFVRNLLRFISRSTV